MAAKSAYTAGNNSTNADRLCRNGINEPNYFGAARSVKLPIERHDLSPVSKFREEQKGALYNSNLSTTYSSVKTSPSTNGHHHNHNHKYSSPSSASRQDNSIPVYASSLLYSELTERNPSLHHAYKSKANSTKNIENPATTNSAYPSSKHERLTAETAYYSRPTTRLNSTYKVIKYPNINDDKLY
jgi:hypothetical protein